MLPGKEKKVFAIDSSSYTELFGRKFPLPARIPKNAEFRPEDVS